MSDYQPTPPPAYPPGGYAPQQKSPVLSILAMIFGILGVLGSFLYGIGFLPGVAGIVLGFIGRRKEPAAKGFWLTGIITGFVAVAISIITVIVVVVIFASIAANNPGAFSSN